MKSTTRITRKFLINERSIFELENASAVYSVKDTDGKNSKYDFNTKTNLLTVLQNVETVDIVYENQHQ